MNPETLRTIALYLGGGMLIALVLALLLFVIVLRQLKKIDVPAHAGFTETLRYTPFSVVLFIDLLDLALDFLAAPFAWVILDRLGLKGLRAVSAIEAIIPFTQPIPTMTLCWLFVRLFPNVPLEAENWQNKTGDQ
ncbi:MAG: hypothetical protein H6662_05810 [Ardenticatenaceae bacterium]|nr:hypothetical protein [Anaerolineales bacterium]MCB8921080.1 hypothetical protein [Ardenticatenaceae bacterium]MCB9005365.1 hypothetical protein [Ardenticatenaceae bacterium]